MAAKTVYALPREIVNAVGILTEVRERPMRDKFAQAKVTIEIEGRIVDALVRLAKSGRIVYCG